MVYGCSSSSHRRLGTFLGADIRVEQVRSKSQLHRGAVNQKMAAMSLKAASLENAIVEGELVDTFAKIVQFWDDEHANGPFRPMDLHTACSNGEYTYVRDLIKEGADVERRNMEQWTPLAYASYGGHDNVVNLLVEQVKVNVNARTGASQMTPLMWAAACNHESIVCTLVNAGAEKEAEDTDGRTCLAWSIITDHKSMVETLLDRGCNIEHADRKSGWTPLLLAVQERNEAIVELLVQRGANVDVLDKTNNSATQLAQQQPVSTAILHVLEAALRRKRGSADPVLRGEAGLSLGCESLSLDAEDDIRTSQTPPPGTARLPTFNTIEQFLTYLNLQKYIALFQKQKISFEMVLEMDEAQLKAIGLSLFGPRRKIYFAAQRLKECR